MVLIHYRVSYYQDKEALLRLGWLVDHHKAQFNIFSKHMGITCVHGDLIDLGISTKLLLVILWSGTPHKSQRISNMNIYQLTGDGKCQFAW